MLVPQVVSPLQNCQFDILTVIGHLVGAGESFERIKTWGMSLYSIAGIKW